MADSGIKDEPSLLMKTLQAMKAQATKQARQTRTFQSGFKLKTDYQHIRTSKYGK